MSGTAEPTWSRPPPAVPSSPSLTRLGRWGRWLFKGGGPVVKNVTGYDLPKLLAGSFGTLAVMDEVTVKVLPRPEKTRTVLLYGLDAAAAIGHAAAVELAVARPR